MKNKLLFIVVLAISLRSFGQFNQFASGGNNFGQTNGFPFNVNAIGIGTFQPATPNARLHIDNFLLGNPNGPLNGLLFRTDGNQGVNNMWQMFTGTNTGNVTEKGRVFTSPNLIFSQNGSVTGMSAVTNSAINQLAFFSPQGDIVLAASGVTPFPGPFPSERMRITGFNLPIPNMNFPTSTVTRVSISQTGSPITTPLSLLHIGHPWASWTTGPHRDWMDIGTYCHEESDGMYVGLKHLASDVNEAIVSFGNNPAANPNNGDRMRFLFVGAPGNGTSTTNQGLEFMHFVTLDGTNPRLSIGDFQTQGGNSDPNNTVEILPSLTSPYWGWGGGNGSSTSGLRLQRLTSASIIVPNGTNGVDNTKVATVDINGDVVLTTPPPLDADNGCSMDGPTVGKVHLGNNVGNAQAALLNDREVPLANHNIIFSGAPDNFPGKIGFGIVGGINNANPLSLRPSPITMQVNGSLSIFDGTGNTSIFFGEEQHPASSGTLGEWGIQYDAGGPGGLNFWKPFGSNGYNFGNKFLYLCNNGNVGIGATAANPPGNTLEITSYPSPLSPQPAGLRFTNLTSAATPVTNPGLGVLAVDANGDVIYVDANGGGSGFGNPCGGTQVPLASDWEIPLGSSTTGYSYIFSGQGTSKYNVGIGTTCSPSGKLEVIQSSTNPNSLGIRSINTDQDGVALRAESIGQPTGPFTKVAGWFESTNFFTANDQVAIFVPSKKGIVNIGFATPNFFASGILNINGSGFAVGGTWQISDSSLKHSVMPMNNSLDKIMHLQPVTFEWDTVRDTLMSGVHAGFIAEQVNNVIPQVVRSVNGDMKAISYSEFIPYVVKGMQEQQLSIDSLRNNPAGGSILGNACGGAQNALSGNWEIPLNGRNFIFSSSNSTGNVAIGGYNCNLPDKLSVLGSSAENNTGVHITNVTNSSSSAAYLSFTNDIPDNNAMFNFHSSTYSSPSDLEITTPANIDLSPANYSNINLNTVGGVVNVNAVNPSNIPAGTSLAVHETQVIESTSSDAHLNINFGSQTVAELGSVLNGYGRLQLFQPENSMPVISLPATGQTLYFNTLANIGVNTTNPSVTLDVNGTVKANAYQTSDSTLKTNILPLNNSALDKVKAFRAVSYEWIDKKDTAMYGTQYGFTAQQIETIVPGLVKTDKEGKKILSSNGIIAFLTKAMQEQQVRLDHQDSLINALAAQVSNCCNNGNHNGNARTNQTIDVELTDADAIVLNQNVPNPFAEQTTISYNIPKSVEAAQILFYDINGRLIKTVDITKKGKGQLNVFANDLSNGVYSYTLIADGKIFETKKMVKQQ